MSEVHEHSNKTVVSVEGMKKLEEKLQYLTTVRRAEVAEQIAVARGFGDLSENAEYDEAKNEQSRLEAEILELENDIHSTGFYRNKAKNIRECCRILDEKFGGEVPDSMEELVQLPGVGRKTANCVLGTFFNIADGVVVDTHVLRLAQRLGLSNETTPEKIEQDLMSIVPREKWVRISHQLILLGRNICAARAPKCEKCPFQEK